MYTTMLFDLDGTLIDTSPGIFTTVNYTMEQLGYEPLGPSQLRKFVGPPLAACFRIACGLPQSLINEACEIYRARYKQGALFDASVYDGMLQALDELLRRGVTLAVATLKHERSATAILQHFGLADRFSAVAGSDEDGVLSKGHIIRNVLSRIDVLDTDNVLMIGDTPHDLDGALEAQVDFLGVDWGFGYTRGHRIEPEAHIVGCIKHPSQLISFA